MLRNLVVHSSPLCINAEPCLKKKKRNTFLKLHCVNCIYVGFWKECALPLKVCVY